MGRCCFVPNCSGAKEEKVIVFKAPSDPKRLAAWDAAIGRKDRPLTPRDGVCIRHFAEEMIIRRRYFAELGGETLLDVPKRSALASNAVPCIFPPPANLGPKKRNRLSTARPPPERSKRAGAVEAAVMPQECPGMLVIKEELREPPDECPDMAVIKQEEREPLGLIDHEPEQCCLDILSEVVAIKREEIEPSGLAEQEQCVGSACDRTSQATFQEQSAGADTGAIADTAAEKAQAVLAGRNSHSWLDWLDPPLVNLPDTAWNYHRVLRNGLNSFCFVQVSLTPSGRPLSSKVLMVQQVEGATFSLSTFALDREVSSPWLPNLCHLHCPNDWSVVSSALGKFHELKLCTGGPLSEEYADVQLECGYKDITGVWRHNRCPFLLEDKMKCSHCWQLKNTLRMHKVRKDRRENSQ